MKLLFVLDAVDYPGAVNPRLAKAVAAVLAAGGHRVDLLQLWDGLTEPGGAAGCRSLLLKFADERRMNEALEHGNAAGASTPVRLARLAARPDAALAAVRALALHRPRRRAACQKEIERLDGEMGYDAVVAVAAPYHAAAALAAARVGGKKAAWLMDPYSQNRGWAVPARALAEETALYRAMDAIFVTRLMEPDYAPGGVFAEFGEKAHRLEFPALVAAEGAEGAARAVHADAGAAGPEHPAAQSPAPADAARAAQKAADGPAGPAAAKAPGAGGIRCVFVGNLYPELRTPEFALRLFLALDDEELTLAFFGGGWEHFPPESPVGRLRAEAEARLGKRLAIHGPVPPAEARRLVAGADILLSLGNTVANQLPSKVFEYCGAGLPVLHLAERPDDAALPYFARWPLACAVQRSEGLGPAVLARVRSFLHKNAGRRLPFAEAERLFAENTPAAVAARLLALLGG